jgi:flagellar assembly factor FliW
LFGHIEIDESQVITFPGGLPGFEDLNRFVLIVLEKTRPFFWLQALDRDIALPLISPFDIEPDYAPVIDDSCLADLNLAREEDLLVFAVAVIPAEVQQMTANLAAPILINIANNRGCQVLTEDDHYKIRQPIYAAVCSRMQDQGDLSGRSENAGPAGQQEEADLSGQQEEAEHAGHHETA